jgi:RNA polymerase-binding transcription factor DksA
MSRTLTPVHPTDRSALRAMLEEQRRFRLDQLAQLDVQSGEARSEYAGRYLDPLDASADRARTEVSAVLAAAAQQALEDIEAALARMDAGTYGACERCDAAIPPERLEAVPQARLCMSCQRRAERRR